MKELILILISFLVTSCLKVSSEDIGPFPSGGTETTAPTIELVSAIPSTSSVGGNGIKTLRKRSISADGRYIAFESPASDLVNGDMNGSSDIFVRDLQLGTTSRVSVDSAELESDGHSDSATISANGRFVVFISTATNLVANDTNGTSDAFVRDLQLGTTSRVSVDSAGVETDTYIEMV